jgi:hypothetical protein
MPNPIIKIVNAETGEEIEREMTAAEFKDLQDLRKSYQEKYAAQDAKAESKSALLERLGITADEAALLLS